MRKFCVPVFVVVLLIAGIIFGYGCGLEAIAVYPDTVSAPIATTQPAAPAKVTVRYGIVPVASSTGYGSGVVVGQADDFYVVATARHVVDFSGPIAVDGVVAEVTKRSDEHDLALLRVRDVGQRYEVLKLGTSDVGDRVRSFGYHWANFYQSNLMVNNGYVSSRDFMGFIAYDGGLYPGNSGGALVNDRGEVIGIVVGVAIAWGHPQETVGLSEPACWLREMLAEEE